MHRVAQLLGKFRFLPGPIIAVEMTAIARRRWLFVLRFGYPLLLLFAVLCNNPRAYAYPRETTLAMMAESLHQLFITYGVMQILAVVFVGPALAAGTIASERERRTIEYLFASTLNDSEIILGKLFARLASIVYFILAGMPVLAISMVMGGIAPQTLMQLFIITFSTAAFVAVLSVCISAFSKRPRDAVISTYLVLIVFMCVPFIDPTYVFSNRLLTVVVGFFTAAQPLNCFAKICMSTSILHEGWRWAAVYNLVQNQAIMAGLMLVFSTAMMRRSYLRQSGAGGRRPRWRFRLFAGRMFAGSLVNRPMLWKEICAEPAARLGYVGFAALAIIYAAVLGLSGYWLYEVCSSVQEGGRNSWDVRIYLWFADVLAATVGSGAVLLIGARAACGVTSEKERDCWDSLISAPLEAHEIVFAKMAGSIWAMRGCVPLLVACWLPMAVVEPAFLFALPFECVTLLTVSAYAAALGTQLSLGAKSSMRAMAATIGIMLFFGGGYLFCCIPCMFGGGLGEGATLVLGPFVPFLIFFPVIGITEFWREMGSHNEVAVMMTAYLCGTFAYGFAAAVLYASAADRFDRVSGRTQPRHYLGQKMVENGRIPPSPAAPSKEGESDSRNTMPP